MAGLSDEELAKRLNDPAAAPAPQAGGALSDEQFAAHLASQPDEEAYDGSYLGGILRSATQGATFDTADNILGMVGGDAEGMRTKDEAFARENPWTHGIAKGAGMILPTAAATVIPGAQPAAGTGASSLGGRVWNGVRWLMGANNVAAAAPRAVVPASRAAAAISRVPFFGRPLGAIARRGLESHAGQGGIAAVKLGALDRAGMADTDARGQDWDSTMSAATGRAQAALDPAAAGLDYLAGAGSTAAFNAAGRMIGRGIDEGRNAIARAAGESGADGGTIDVARQMHMDGADAQAVRDQVFPAYRGQQQGQVMRIMERYGEMRAQGAADPQARAAVVNELVAGGAAPQTAARQVREIVRRYETLNAIPAQLNELTAIASNREGGQAANTHNLFRAALNMKGDNEAASVASDFMASRQPQIGARLTEHLERELGDGDIARMLAEYERNRGASNGLYGAFMDDFANTPEAADALQQAIENTRLSMAMRLRNRTDDIAQAVRGQLEKFTNPETQFTPLGHPGPDPMAVGPTNTGAATDLGNRGMRDLDAFIHQRRALTDAIEKSRVDFRDTATTHDLRDFKRTLDDSVRGIADTYTHGNPDTQNAVRGIFANWRGANDNRALLEGLQRAYNDGITLQPMARGKNAIALERTLRRIETQGEDHQRFFLRGVMSKLKSDIESQGDLHNTAKIFSNPRMRALMGRLMGDDASRDFYQLVQRANLAKRSQMADKNSPTGSIIDEKQRAMLLNKLQAIANSVLTMATSPTKFVGGIIDDASNALFRQQMGRTMELMGTNTDHPHLLIQALRDIENAGRYARPNIATPYIDQVGPFVAQGAVPMLTDEPQRQRRRP